MDKTNKSDRDKMDDGQIADAFRAFGFVHRGGSRPNPLNVRLGVTHQTFASDDYLFRKACALAGVEPTKRQASRWRNKKGKAYQFKGKASQDG